MDKQRLGRRLTQVLAALVYNANIKGFTTGTLYRGDLKKVCVPGLNCYSCPGAIASCPLGSLQGTLNSFPRAVGFYVIGMLLLFGVLFGRFVCGFLCPFGLVQDLLGRIPTKKIRKSRATRILSLTKYAVLAVLVIGLPIFYKLRDGVAVPAFCKYICPSGTLFGAFPLIAKNPALLALTGALFDWKVLVLVAILVLSIFIFRPFCRFICPLGAIYSFFNKIAIFGVKLDKSKCTGCGACVSCCPSDVKCVNDRECIRCGECKKVCPTGAIYTSPGRRIKPESEPKHESEG